MNTYIYEFNSRTHFTSSPRSHFSDSTIPLHWLTSRQVIMGGLPIENSSSTISHKDQVSTAVASEPDSKPKKKICCACPDTKKLRDECIVENGESACENLIEAHRKCLRAEGFNI